MRIGIVDGQGFFREGLRAVAERQPDLAVAWHTDTADEAMRSLQAHPTDVVILDSVLGSEGGLSIGRAMLRLDPRLSLFYLTAYGCADCAVEALSFGARGYALKSDPAESIFEGLRQVAAGRAHVSPSLSPPPDLERARAALGAGGASHHPDHLLTRRERQVFHHLVNGSTNERLSAALGISIRTTETHRARIMSKLKVHSLADLVRIAMRHGLLSGDSTPAQPLVPDNYEIAAAGASDACG